LGPVVRDMAASPLGIVFTPWMHKTGDEAGEE
jgi:hypothetical protein